MQSDMTSRIMGALENEPTILAPQAVASADKVTHIRPRFSKYSWSIAASVAAAFFVGMFVLDQPEVGSPAQIADNDTEQYVLAHHNYAPTSVTYYTQNVSYTAGE